MGSAVYFWTTGNTTQKILSGHGTVVFDYIFLMLDNGGTTHQIRILDVSTLPTYGLYHFYNIPISENDNTISGISVLDGGQLGIYFGGRRLYYLKGTALQWNMDITTNEEQLYVAKWSTHPTSLTLVGRRGSVYKVGPAGCFNCHITCLTCSGPADTECLTCHPWATFNTVTGKCDEPCHADCDTCTGPAINECVTCASPLVLSSENYCCHADCLTCTGSLNTQCATCASNKYLTSTNGCALCNGSCLTCSGGLTTECLTCHPGYALQPDNSC
jgi:hypothetical protein